MESVRAFEGWIPIRVYMRDGQAYVHWFYLADITLDDAYFFETIARAAKHPFNLVFARHTPIEFAGRIAEQRSGLEPSGFLLHMSRCGSTLVSRSFALRADTLVVAEAGPIDDVLTVEAPGITDDVRATWLRWIVDLLTRRREPEQTRAVIKLDAWHARFLRILQRAYPDVPWVFLHRNPLEVLVSHLRTPSYMMAFGKAPAASGMSVPDAARIGRADYCVRVLSAILDGVRASDSPPRCSVSYRELPDAIWERIGPAFGLTFSEREIARVRAGAAYHAKQPMVTFVPDSQEKSAAVTPELRAAAAALLERYRWYEGPAWQ